MVSPLASFLIVALLSVGIAAGLSERKAGIDSGRNPKVTLASGILIGTTTTVATVPTAVVTQYLGVRFASVPERFALAKPVTKWEKPIKAQKRPPVCIQQFPSIINFKGRLEEVFNDPGNPPPAESEDCLFLNIFQPPGTTPNDKKPVLFWVFGGNLAFGGGSLRLYDGNSFVYYQDVIVVTHNYRTNVFGFPGSPQIPIQQQNIGFWDQRLALKWVQENIARFGGDPSKVTIFGESAGGLSVRSLVGYPPKPLPFRGAIMESEAAGCTNIPFGKGNSTSGSSWSLLAHLAGCSERKEQLGCMRNKTASTLKSVGERANILFCPFEDGMTFKQDIRPLLQAGTAAKVPWIIGTNKDEGRFVPYVMGLSANNEDHDKLKSILGNLTGDIPGLRPITSTLIDQLPLRKAFGKLVTDIVFLCPAAQLASSAAKAGYQVWRYQYEGVFPGLRTFPEAGAYHTSEIPTVFGIFPTKYGRVTKEQRQSSAFMQKAWADFAKDPHKGPAQAWPALGRSGKLLSIRNKEQQAVPTTKIDSLHCALLNALIGQKTI